MDGQLPLHKGIVLSLFYQALTYFSGFRCWEKEFSSEKAILG